MQQQPAAQIPPAPTAAPAQSHPPAAAPPAAPVLQPLPWRRGGQRRRLGGAAAAPVPAPIAVIGMAGQFPQADTLQAFWDNIAAGKDCITEVAPARWDSRRYYQPGPVVAGKTNCKWLGALAHYDCFDPLFFNISPTEAERMDPQQRLFLQTCWHSIEAAGYSAEALSGSQCGVFVGCTGGDYYQGAPAQQLSAQGFTGGAPSILAARIAYFLNLQGPCVSIDTACSSSLVAIASACDSLTSAASDLALAGGVYVMAGPELHIQTAQAGMLSPDGRCFSFDRRANGFVPGESVGVVVLKRLADAERDGDRIHAVVRGWGVNQDGKTNGITAPNPVSQTRLQQRVYAQYRIDPAAIQLIETHGTGTQLGDPIEIEGLRAAFKPYTRDTGYCALGSVKSNIGHCITAAGVSGFVKLVLALQHRQLPPTINFEQLNAHIDLSDSPFYINDRLRAWTPAGAARRQAAISSFGFSGTNAHMVLAEYLPPQPRQPAVAVLTENRQLMIPLSARTAAQLQQKAGELLAFIDAQAATAGVDLVSLAYTLQVGREAMAHRLGVMAASPAQLAEALRAYLAGEPAIAGLYRGQVAQGQAGPGLIGEDQEVRDTLIERWLARRQLSRLLGLWVQGVALDWHRLYGESRPQRLSLPLYPFARERYWLERAAPPAPLSSRGATAFLHPLLHSNVSDLSRQRYCTRLQGEEFFLADHRVDTGAGCQPVLPAAAYLEMARAAVEHAVPAPGAGRVPVLRHIVWAQPLVVTAPQTVTLGLSAGEGDGDGIAYEIASGDGEEALIHCHGQAVFEPVASLARLDLAALRGQLGQSGMGAAALYRWFGQLGLEYGPAHRGLVSVQRGAGQLLAQVVLPAAVADSEADYRLHPGVLDSVLQAALVLTTAPGELPALPALPFALDTLRLVGACPRELFAWVRYAEGRQADEAVVKLDIDLCDGQGDICVQMRGFYSRAPAAKDGRTAATENIFPFDDAFYQKVIENVLNNDISVDEAARLG